ncbi:MAG: helicase [Gordonia sp.]|uniref:UvrD-helicase domain-containing protein n=1 Tax=Gordonia sp. (in: high G+C Gram-positive bacteria) TaxID=84139 RepID=UPI000C41D35B|nr:UvrD-helicase domain-containing protein [Gordonia sp. (in: high G+C Gram-positive bacteria)]MAU84684.1 helicase [Gordonia sp. (in: high G+C Gram-positive bacteria)]
MTIDLDNAQRAVAEAPADARLVVTAGAGQGKTEVVAARLRYLAEEEELSSSTELMVLSFSRAAVQAVRTRVEHYDLGETNVRTFDSFASYLLVENGIEPIGSFANRIRQAAKLLGDQSKDLDGLEEIRHVILDEVQDLVGDRAEMVLALLSRLDDDAGFTALGDPLQGIYDFTLEDSRSQLSSSEFHNALTNKYGALPLGLQRNYRAQGRFPKEVVGLGHSIRDLDDVTSADRAMTQFEYTLPHSGEVADWSFLVEEESGRTAVLCETNAEVLRVSRFLAAQGVQHVVRRPAQEFGAAPWIAEVFRGLTGPEVARTDVESVIESMLESILRDRIPEDAWYLLKGAEGRSRSMYQLNLARIRSQIRSGAIPLTLTQPDSAKVIVSTVHRAKGLEFDRVYFVHPNYDHSDSADWAEVRQRYVALSRARDEVAVIDIPREWTWFKKVAGRQRECKKSWKRNTYVAAMEVSSGDVLTDKPTPAELVSGAGAQETLRGATPGMTLAGVFDPSMSDEDHPVFSIRTERGDELGWTTRDFGTELVNLFGYRFTDGWDGAVLNGIRLVSVETAAGDPQLTRDAGIGDSGLWLVPRVTGLVTPSND